MLLLLSASSPINSAAQAPHATGATADSAAWIVERFFARDGFPDRARHYTGEMLRHYRDSPTLGAGLAPNVRVAHRVLVRDERRAIFAATLGDTARASDWYLYLERERGDWKLAAVRSFAMPAEFHALLDSLNASGTLPPLLMRLRERMRLASRSDSALAHHLRTNWKAFDELASLMSEAHEVELVGHDGLVEPTARRQSVSPRFTALLNELRLSSAYRADDHAGCLFLGILAVADNEVGFLYAPPDCRVPAMNPELFIYVDRVLGRWYVYRTT
ncbi:MAG TPA: hypothetical protein VJ596_00550 [Gemmatimonadaceae bacterium]|nr:hypothetical protein [Gemmatimonadaceae bacterium]